MEDEIGSKVFADARAAVTYRADRALVIPDDTKALRE